MAPPSRPAESQDSGSYDLAESALAKPRASDPAMTTPAKVGDGAAPRPAAQVQQIDYKRATTPGSSTLEHYFPDRVKDLFLPLALIGGGTVVEFGRVLLVHWSRSMPGPSLLVQLQNVGLTMLINAALMLIALFITAKVRGINFGPFWTAVLKLCAISIAPGAISTVVLLALGFMPLILAAVAAIIISFIIYFALIGALFDLDESDTWFCVVVAFLMRLGIYITLMLI